MIGRDKTQKTRFIQLVLFYTCFIGFVIFSKAVLPTHFLKEGLGLNQILLGVTLSFMSQLLVILCFPLLSNRLSSRSSWRISIFSFLIYMLLVIQMKSLWIFYLASFISGFTTTFFYAFYNIAHFKLTPKTHIGHSSALMFNIGPLLGVMAPLLSGALANRNYYYVWLLAAFLFFVPLLLVKKQYNFAVDYDFKKALSEIKSTRIFIFIEGVWEALHFGIIPVYTLFFIKSPLSYGSYIAYLSIVAVLANLFFGKMSDRIQKRALFLYPITFLMAIITLMFPLGTKNIYIWIMLTGAIQFLLPLFWSFSTALVVDSHANIDYAFISRELMLSSGRVTGLVLTFISFSLESSPFYIFFVLGSVMLLFPLTLFWRTKYSKKYSYM